MIGAVSCILSFFSLVFDAILLEVSTMKLSVVLRTTSHAFHCHENLNGSSNDDEFLDQCYYIQRHGSLLLKS